MTLLRKVAALSVAGIALMCSAWGQQTQATQLDTTTIAEAEVRALRIPTPASKAAGNIQLLPATKLQNGHSPDLQDALNSIPGVFMETRGLGGSRRLQIRSSGLRSPFGVRNILMLMDGFVLTNASGNSPLELWNPQAMHALEVVKGPVGALYGNAYGGALLGSSLPDFHRLKNRTNGYAILQSPGQGSSMDWSQEAGFSHTQLLNRKKRSAIHVRMMWNDAPGYRDQEYNQRNQVELHALQSAQPESNSHIWLGWMDAEWGLPGSLNAASAAFDPTTAPGASYDAKVQRQRTWLGWSREIQRGNRESGTWLYGQVSDKFNPFGTSPFFNGVKDESEQFLSVRWWNAHSKALGERGKVTLDQSIIARYESLHLQERDNDYAPASTRYAIDFSTQSHWASLGARLEWDEMWQLDVQLAAEHMNRNSQGERRVIADSMATYAESYRVVDPLPFFQLSYQWRPEWRAFIQWGNGGSHPTSFELVDPEGYQPYQLQPEEANAVEFGTRWIRSGEQSRWDGIVQAYHQRVSQAIAQVPGPADGIYMDNIDGLQMTGVEGSLQWDVQLRESLSMRIRLWANWNRQSFEPYAEVLPGTPQQAGGTDGVLRWRHWDLGWAHQWIGRIKLHNYLDDWADNHHRLNVHVGWSDHRHAVQLGVRNALNQSYSGWAQTNAFGGRYFNPAPGRAAWVSWRWNFTE